MAYEKGNASDFMDFMDKLRLFFLGQGYSTDAFATEGSGKRLHMHKGSFYLNFKGSSASSTDLWSGGYGGYAIGFNIGTGYDSSKGWGVQPGSVGAAAAAPWGYGVPVPNGPLVDYEIFYDPAYNSALIVLQTATGVRRWLAFGEALIKVGGWTGGAWFSGSTHATVENYPYGTPGALYNGAAPRAVGTNCNTQSNRSLGMVFADIDSSGGAWIGWCHGEDYSWAKKGSSSLSGDATVPSSIPRIDGVVSRARNSLNSLSVLLPIHIYAARTMGSYSLIGALPNLFATNVTGLAVAQEYTLGTDKYVPYAGAAAGTVVKKV